MHADMHVTRNSFPKLPNKTVLNFSRRTFTQSHTRRNCNINLFQENVDDIRKTPECPFIGLCHDCLVHRQMGGRRRWMARRTTEAYEARPRFVRLYENSRRNSYSVGATIPRRGVQIFSIPTRAPRRNKKKKSPRRGQAPSVRGGGIPPLVPSLGKRWCLPLL